MSPSTAVRPRPQPTADDASGATADRRGRTALITGATGYVGGQLVPEMLRRGWRVRVLSRSADKIATKPWGDDVEVTEGDATDGDALRSAMEGVDVAYYLLHSMDTQGNFVERDREMAQTFTEAAESSGVGRLVYLGGLHPEGDDLSAHLSSRVEVGEIMLRSSVPAAVVQAGVVLGDGSVSFDMLRHLTERLPAFVAPKWLRSKIQPIAVDDVVDRLAVVAELGSEHDRTFDVGGPDVLTYAEMMQRYARQTGLRRRLIVTLPVLTPGLASHWVGLVTPVSSGVATPLVGSLVHDAVVREDDLTGLVGPPPGGGVGYEEAVRRATRSVDPKRWSRWLRWSLGVVGAAAVVGTVASDPRSDWYRSLDLPRWQPPVAAFPVVWSALYAGIALVSAATGAELEESDAEDQAKGYRRALETNMALNAGWCLLFFQGHRVPGLRRVALAAATAECAVLTASSADLARRSAPAGRGRVVVLGAYAAWSAFATVLSGTIWRRNPGR